MGEASARCLFVCSALLLALAQTAGEETLLEFIPRNYSGAGNNIANPEWGSVGITQIRAVAGSDYAGDVFTPPGDDRPTAREIMTDIFLSSTATLSTKSVVFVAWGQLLTYDLSLTIDNGSEPFDIACDDGGGVPDVWCPLGTNSEDISFNRSNAAVSNSSTRDPINYATSFIDLDYMYGRSEETARRFRTLESGFMNVTQRGIPFRNADGTWMIPDQRTARFPVTFALHVMLLLEHNRCCVDVAPVYGFEGDEDIYQACRGWTIAIFQHMVANDFILQLLGDSIYTLGRDSSPSTSTSTSTSTGTSTSSSSSAAVNGLDRTSDATGGDTEKRRRTRRLAGFQHKRVSLAGEEEERPHLTVDNAGTETGFRSTGISLGREGGEQPALVLEDATIDVGWPQVPPEAGAGWGWKIPLENESSAGRKTLVNPELPRDGSSALRDPNTAELARDGVDAGGESTTPLLRRARSGARKESITPSLQRERSSDAERAPIPPHTPRRRLAYSLSDYDNTIDPGADVFTLTAGAAAFESALPSTVRIVSEGYASVAEDHIELTVACEDLAGLFERNDVGDILRGAVLSPALAVDTYYPAAVSNLSPLFKLPVDAVQRGRDHGLPTYNSVREAYGLTAASAFSDITADASIAALLSDAYGGDIDNLDAITGALAEDPDASTGGVFGNLLVEAWIDQLFRSIAGDRVYHFHGRIMETVYETTLSDVINRTLNVHDLPLSTFTVPGVTVCASDCGAGVGEADVTLSDAFGMSWQMLDEDMLSITLKAKDIGDSGMLAIGWGGLTMLTAQDYVICEVISATEGECTDSSQLTAREVPTPDLVDPELNVTRVSIEDDWTTITFLRDLSSLDDEDYDLNEDIESKAETLVIYSYREGAGVGQHPNGNRGASSVNFATGGAEGKCNDDDNFESLHGALMLIAWMFLAPAGIYYIRYRKGDAVTWAGRQWYEMHEEIMIVTAEAVLPLGITAVAATGGDHTTKHAHWGYYMIAAVAAQVFTGWMRTKGLKAEHSNFSFLHRCNKYFHIWAGRFAYLAGVVQCYRGLELVSGSDELLFSTFDGLDLELGSFRTIKHYVFPVWLAAISIAVIFLESRKQYRRFFKKGSANLCACVTVINEGHVGVGHAWKKNRLMPRTEDVEIYTVKEFNDKVLNGQMWVLIDGAILDVSNFSQRHPGGARLVLNAVGTDVTYEMLGEELSVGHAMSFSPHVHPEEAWKIARSLVVGYIEEDDDEEYRHEKDQEDKRRETEDRQEGERKRREEDKHKKNGDRKRRDEDPKEGENKRREEEKEKERHQEGLEGEAPPVPGKKEGYFNFGRNGLPNAGSKMPIAKDSLDGTARRLKRLASISVMSTVPQDFGPLTRTGAAAVAPSNSREMQADTISPGLLKSAWGRPKLLERFHVCPLLFRERMQPPSKGMGPSSNSRSKRPVYRYIFSCPGQAHALVKSITGVCYVNMRAQDTRKGVIQRSYHAFAVRVHDSQASSTPGRGGKGGGGTGGRTYTITPAKETTVGTLCVELRIKLHHDGAMSQLLEKLANDTDNPAVQLQGPFIISKLAPPPAHHNVIMIAADTGINPMVQQIRLYNALPRSRSRLALVWQCASEAELYGMDEITGMQARSKGLLELTVLVSGHHRKRNVPGAAFAKAKRNILVNAKNLISPIASSTGSHGASAPPSGRAHQTSDARLDSNNLRGGGYTVGGGGKGREGLPPAVAHDQDMEAEAALGESFTAGWDIKQDSHQHLSGEEARPTPHAGPAALSTPRRRAPFGMASDPVETRLRGKVTRDVLDKVFGSALLATLEKYSTRAAVNSETVLPRWHSGRDGQGCDDDDADVLSGKDGCAGQVQVVVSGPSSFVLSVEAILAEMGVPSAAIVLLD